MSNKRIECLNVSELSTDIKKKILLKAGIKENKINDPESIDSLTDQQVVDAIKLLEEKNLREQLDQANNLIKLNQISSALDHYLETYKAEYEKRKGKKPGKSKTDKIVNDYLLSKLDRDIMLSFPSDQGLTKSAYSHMYMSDAANILNGTIKFTMGLKTSEKMELEKAIVRLMDGRDGENNSNTINSKKVLDTYKDVYREIQEWEKHKLTLIRKSGMYVDERDDFYFSQSHNPISMLTAGKEEWKNEVKKRMDTEKSVTPDDITAEQIGVDEYLDKFYESVLYGNEAGRDPFQLGSGGNETLRNRFNQQRLLQFKSATDALEYKIKFGNRESFIDDMLTSVNQDADLFGLSSTLGTNPERNLKILQNYFEVPNEYKGRQDGLLSHTLGNMNNTNNGLFHNMYRFMKGSVYSSIMGGTSITSYWGDGAAMARTFKEFGFHNNTPYAFSGFKDFSSAFHKMITDKSSGSYAQKILNNPDQKTLADKTMTNLDGILNIEAVQARFGDDYAESPFVASSGDDLATVKRKQMYNKVGNFGGKMANTVFKITGQTRLQRTLKNFSNSVALSNIDVYRKYSFDQLQKENNNLYQSLKIYGKINEADWENIRNIKDTELTGQSIRELGETNYDTAVKIHNFRLAAQALSVQEASSRVNTKFQYAQSNKDDPMRILMDSVLMLKSFLMQAVPNITNRARFRYNRAIANGQSRKAAIALATGETLTFVASSMAAAYMIIATKALISGNTPPDPSIFFEGGEDGMGMSKRQQDSILTLLMTGGGLGILGDILMYDSSKYGKDTSDILIGPVPDRVSSILDYTKDLYKGDATLYGTINSIDRNLPFQNVFYIKELRRRMLVDQMLEIADEEKHNDKKERYKKLLKEKGNQEVLF